MNTLTYSNDLYKLKTNKKVKPINFDKKKQNCKLINSLNYFW